MPVVVLFKSESDGPDKFVQLLEESDYEVRSINCLNFQFKNLESLCEEIQKVDAYEGMIFTSQRAIQAVSKATESDPKQLVRLQEKKNYSVGESTSESAKNLLRIDTKGNESGNAQALASLIVANHQSKKPKPFLFPSGNLKQDILEKLLKENSIEVQCVEAYETVQHSDWEKSIDLKSQTLHKESKVKESPVKPFENHHRPKTTSVDLENSELPQKVVAEKTGMLKKPKIVLPKISSQSASKSEVVDMKPMSVSPKVVNQQMIKPFIYAEGIVVPDGVIEGDVLYVSCQLTEKFSEDLPVRYDKLSTNVIDIGRKIKSRAFTREIALKMLNQMQILEQKLLKI